MRDPNSIKKDEKYIPHFRRIVPYSEWGRSPVGEEGEQHSPRDAHSISRLITPQPPNGCCMGSRMIPKQTETDLYPTENAFGETPKRRNAAFIMQKREINSRFCIMKEGVCSAPKGGNKGVSRCCRRLRASCRRGRRRRLRPQSRRPPRQHRRWAAPRCPSVCGRRGRGRGGCPPQGRWRDPRG